MTTDNLALLRTIFGPNTLDGYTKVQRLPCGAVGAGPQQWVRSAAEVAKFGEANRGGGGTLAYCPAVFAEARDGDDSVSQLRALVLDFDGKDGLPEPSRIYANDALRKQGVTHALSRVNRAEKLLGRCTALVLTGYGFHAVWVFDAPVSLDSGNRRHVKEVLRRVARTTGADTGASTLSHFYRLPGSLNHKGAAPVPAKVVAFRPGERLRFQDAIAAVADFAHNGSGRAESAVAERRGIDALLREGASEGKRHAALVRIAAHAHRSGLRGEALAAHLLAANDKFKPPSPRAEVEKIFAYYEGASPGDEEDDSPPAIAPPRPFRADRLRALGGFVSDYLEYAEALTDAPVVYHVASILPVLAVAIGRRTLLNIAPRRRRITFSSMNVGRSRLTRKTTATDMATDVARRALPERMGPHDCSPEALVDALVAEPALLLSLNEASTIFARSMSDYGKVLLPLLCTLADAPPEYRRRTRKDKEEIVAAEPTLCLLAGSNEALLARHLRPIDVQSGLLPRFFIAYAYKRERTLDVQPPADEVGARALADRLKALTSCAPVEVTLSPGGSRRISEWGAAAAQGTPDEYSALASGAEDVAKKTAALLHVARGGTGVVGIDEAEAAIEVAQYGLGSAVWLVSQHLAETRSGATLNAIREQIRRAMPVGVSRRTLLRSLHVLAREFNPLMETLFETGEVEDRPVGRSTRYFLRDRRHLNPPARRPEASPVTPETTRRDDANYEEVERRGMREG